MKRKLKSYVLGVMLFSIILMMMLDIPEIRASGEINYTFEKDILYEPSNSTVFGDNYNIRNQTLITPANLTDTTYSFTEDAIGETSTDIGFITLDNSDADCQFIINENKDGHSKVLEIEDNSGAGRTTGEGSFTAAGFGTIEYWVYTEDTTLATDLRFMQDGGAQGVVMNIDAGDLQYWDSGWQKIEDLVVDTWYHISIEFDCTVGGYKSLAADTYRVFLNGVEYGDYDYYQVSDTIQKLYMYTADADTGYSTFIDAFGISWDPDYDIGDNIFPIFTETNITEGDRWEFAYSDFPTQYAVDSDVFSDWDEIDVSDHVNIAKDYDTLDNNPSYLYDRKIKIDDWSGSSGNLGIEREFNIIDGIVNVSWSLNFTALDGASQSEMTTEIYSYDDTLIARVYLEQGDICYKDGGSNEVVLESGVITTGEIYDFNLYSDPFNNIMLLGFYIDGVYYHTYALPSLESSKRGLGKIIIQCYYDPPRSMVVYLDNVGVYSNGTSITTEPAFIQVSLDDVLFHQTWYFKEHNLLTLDADGLVGIHLTDWYFYAGTTLMEEIVPATTYSLGSNQTHNIYPNTHDGNDYIYSPMVTLEFYGEFQFGNITIDGVMLTTIGNEVPLTFAYGNVNISESYFYVDSSNRLRYSIVYNDSNTEYIEATFDIIDVLGENRSVSFYGDTNGNYAQFRNTYSDATVNSIYLTSSPFTQSYILDQNKVVDSFSLLISDNGETSNGTTTGYITNLKLLWNPDISVTITTLNLLSMITVLIILVIPTLVITKRVGSKAFIPTFFLMSLLCVATSLIPIWLFVIIVIACASFYIVPKAAGSGF